MLGFWLPPSDVSLRKGEIQALNGDGTGAVLIAPGFRSIQLIFLVQAARGWRLVVVETKFNSNPEGTRRLVAQVIDEAARVRRIAAQDHVALWRCPAPCGRAVPASTPVDFDTALKTRVSNDYAPFRDEARRAAPGVR